MIVFTLAWHNPAMAQNNQQSTVTRADAVQRVMQRVEGRVLRVDQTRNSYSVKVLLKSGRVVTVDVDKRTGQVTKQRSKDK